MSQSTVIDSLEGLVPYEERRFVPKDFRYNDLEEVKRLYEDLAARSVASQKDFERWIQDRSELEAALDQAGSILYIRMTCQTDNEQHAKAYQYFVEEVSPAVQPLEDRLNRRFMELHREIPLDGDRYGVYIRAVESDLQLFRQENIALNTQVQLLVQQYQQVTAGMTVQFEGQERTMPEMGKILLDVDRSRREAAWHASQARRHEDRNRLDDLFDQMLPLRHQIALNAGFQNYADYKFTAMHRFDYTPEDCLEYHRTVERCIVPLWQKVVDRRRASLGLHELRPWDMAVDPEGKPPLKPFEEPAELIAGCQAIFEQVDPTLGQYFRKMSDKGLLDLACRKGKAPGGYQSSLNESRLPFIFMNAVGVSGDVNTLLHEGGHAFHTLASAHEPLVDYRHAPMEFCEVASMAMELLGGDFFTQFYTEEEARRALIAHWEDVIFILLWVATIDSFQHWIYHHPQHTAGERADEWLKVRKRFAVSGVSWQGLENYHASMWQKQLHIFEVPFYYIEYGIAQLGALQLWLNARKNRTEALGQYKAALALGGSRPLPELFAAAGLRFDFSAATIEPLMAAVEQQLEGLYQK